MKFTNKEIQSLLYASYYPELYDVEHFIIDKSISDKLMKVYTVNDSNDSNDSNDVVVVHRGSNDMNDWVDNALHLADVPLTMTKTYKTHLRKHMKAVKKYGKENIVLLSHSRGALYSTQFKKDNLAKQNITYNKPIVPRDVIKSVFETPDKDTIDIRSEGDIPSMGQNLIINKNEEIVIPSDSMNPITNHATEQLLELPDDVLIGNGEPKKRNYQLKNKKVVITPFTGTHTLTNIMKSQIDFTKLRKLELKTFVKLHKAKLGVNITGLRKRELVELVQKILLN